MNAVRASLALLAAMAVAASTASAQDNRRRADDVMDSIAGSIGILELSGLPEALEVNARRFEYDYQSGLLRCSGAVKVTQGDIRLDADELKVVSIAAGNMTFRRITAHGNVRVTNGTETATGTTAVYDQGSATITLSGGAKLGSGNKTVEGDRVVFNLDQGRADIRSESGPVRARIETPDRLPDDEEEFEDEEEEFEE